MVVVGRDAAEGPTADLGAYRARDGSRGAPVEVDLNRPHAALVVGKRGSGKSYTMGVLAEAVAAAPGAVPVVVDPMGAFGGLADSPVGARVMRPRVPAGALPPAAWCAMLDLDPAGGPGSLVWRVASEQATLAAMRDAVDDADAPDATRRAAANHLALADSWDAFDPDGLDAATLRAGPVVLDCSTLARAPATAVVAAVAEGLYAACVGSDGGPLPWLFVDEAHVFAAGVAGDAIRQLLTRGRQPGVSLVAATQRPSALPDVAPSQADLLVAHRLTDSRDREALAAARPTYVDGTLAERMPAEPGEALVVDDATESLHHVRVRERRTPHEGESPRASERAEGHAAVTAHRSG